ncbi:MAG: substrate-binding domain-containing protein [Verrucomicrobia bacterium]|nr:substrate-binding domain-containing protein [Verrucomicrobiota bacterium]MCH8529073.1 substrate-binding domain-containing protein [Kiritimatiellia bacterium]
MPRRTQKYLNILYCSKTKAHRMHIALLEGANERGWTLNAVPWEETSAGRYTGGFPVDGVISQLPPRQTDVLCRTIGKRPHVTMNANSVATLGLPGVVADHVAAGERVAKHFLDLGFTRFAAINSLPDNPVFSARLNGFRGPIHEAGCPPPKRIQFSSCTGLSHQQMRMKMARALQSLEWPLGIMAFNDRVALRIIEASRLMDMSIPAQVAICGFDNDPLTCDLAPIPLSSVDLNPGLQAREACRLMESLLRGESPPRDPVIIKPHSLVTRRSSGVRAHGDPLIAKALACIQAKAWDPDFGVPDLIDQAGGSRNALFATFRRELHCTPLQYITALRVAKARQLLKETPLMVKQIRQQCGFASDYQMYMAFKRTTGHSPGHERARKVSSSSPFSG